MVSHTHTHTKTYQNHAAQSRCTTISWHILAASEARNSAHLSASCWRSSSVISNASLGWCLRSDTWWWEMAPNDVKGNLEMICRSPLQSLFEMNLFQSMSWVLLPEQLVSSWIPWIPYKIYKLREHLWSAKARQLRRSLPPEHLIFRIFLEEDLKIRRNQTAKLRLTQTQCHQCLSDWLILERYLGEWALDDKV